ncbi:site-specific integrase [Xenophilus sp. Marseille-Q4582]|uniref:tyrosine-type recombinase/integrase n=1 Tax=Xenophilus sp. Marseille-Q4582 TaxID=2866600 RepID=UPI001CE4A952|nr:site-specific integrase [Xenophilus sp. Marseille-Q4582]
MATPKQTAAGTWRVQIEVRGERDAGTFNTKREATEWAARRKAELLAVRSGRAGEVRTVADALDRYGEEVSPRKRGETKELLRFEAFKKHPDFPAKVLLSDLTSEHLAAWRDARLKIRSNGAVIRDMVLLADVLEVARREWRWLATNPIRDVRKPAAAPHRERIIQPHETRRLLRALDWSMKRPVRSVRQAVGHCFVAALQTGMRAGELCGLEWADVRVDHVLLHANRTKTGRARQVPLTPEAARVIERMKGFDEVLVFGIPARSLDAMFRKYRERAGLEGFTFHDARHTAATRLARKVDVLDLCKIFGWAATTRALTYYNPTGSQIAKRLSGGAAPSPRSR